MAPSPSTVRHVSDDLENFLPAPRESLLRGLAGQLRTSTRAADQNLGHLEEQLLRGGHELFRQMLEKAAQEKAAAAPPLCPHCQNKLRRLTQEAPNPPACRKSPRWSSTKCPRPKPSKSSNG